MPFINKVSTVDLQDEYSWTMIIMKLKYVIFSQSNANCLHIYPLFAFLELNLTYLEIQALSLAKKTITKINF